MIWLNGQLLEGTHASFDLTDRGLLLGDGVFDTALASDGTIVWREAHLARLLAACAAIGLDAGTAQLRQRISAAMDLAAEGMALGSIRVTVTRGPGPRGVVPPADPVPTVIASRGPMASPVAFRPLSLWLSQVRRNETSLTSRIKSLAYLDNVLETQRARAAGCDEALFRNTRGDIACCGIGNIFALVDGQLLTPPVEAGVLAGVARAAVLDLASVAGLEACEQTLPFERLTSADAVFVTNSLRLLAPVTRIGDIVLRQSPESFGALRDALAQSIFEKTGLQFW